MANAFNLLNNMKKFTKNISEHMLSSIRPITVLPTKLPKRPDIIINDVAIPRYFDGNRFTPTASAILQHEPKHMNSKKEIIVHLNSVKMFSARHPIIDIVNQTPSERAEKSSQFFFPAKAYFFKRTKKKFR